MTSSIKSNYRKLDCDRVHQGDILKNFQIPFIKDDCSKEINVKVTNYRDFEFAQVCTGGILITDINEKTLESKLVKNIFPNALDFCQALVYNRHINQHNKEGK